MTYPKTHKILTNFDLNIVVLLRNLSTDLQALNLNAPLFQQNGIEITIVISPELKNLPIIEALKSYPLVDWTIIEIIESLQCIAIENFINLGILASSKSYVMILDSRYVLKHDCIFRLRYIAENYQQCFAVGKLYSDTDKMSSNSNCVAECSPLLTKKAYLEKIANYNYNYIEGNDLKNLQSRLEYAGVKKVFVHDAIFSICSDAYVSFTKDNNHTEINLMKRSQLLKNMCDLTSGHMLETQVVFTKKKIREILFKSYLETFVQYWIKSQDIILKKHSTIALIQVYNEEEHLPDVLEHLDKICDGIILIDDSSTDDSYKLAESEKIILKVKKKRSKFNDLENRNILINLSSFFNNDWLFFIDADERIDLYGKSLTEEFIQHGQDAYCFQLVHLWDNTESYRTDIPDDNDCINFPGVMRRWRAFRNKGRYEIHSDRALHFPASPLIPSTITALPVLVRHYGNLTEAQRKIKHQTYINQDIPERKERYSYLLDKQVKLESVNKLRSSLKEQFSATDRETLL